MNMDIFVNSVIAIGGILLAGLLFMVAFKWKKGKWLRLLAGNTFGDASLEKARNITKKCSVLINVTGIFILLITLSIVFSLDSKIILSLLGIFLIYAGYYLVVSLKEWVMIVQLKDRHR